MFVGDISYSLYLWHWPPLVLLPYALARPLSPTLTLGVVVGMFVLAWAPSLGPARAARGARTASAAPRATWAIARRPTPWR